MYQRSTPKSCRVYTFNSAFRFHKWFKTKQNQKTPNKQNLKQTTHPNKNHTRSKTSNPTQAPKPSFMLKQNKTSISGICKYFQRYLHFTRKLSPKYLYQNQGQKRLTKTSYKSLLILPSLLYENNDAKARTFSAELQHHLELQVRLEI